MDEITQSEIKTIKNIDLEFTVCIPIWIEMPYSDGFFETSYIWYDIFVNCNWVVTRWQ